jgi:hypothetical protein
LFTYIELEQIRRGGRHVRKVEGSRAAEEGGALKWATVAWDRAVAAWSRVAAISTEWWTTRGERKRGGAWRGAGRKYFNIFWCNMIFSG